MSFTIKERMAVIETEVKNIQHQQEEQNIELKLIHGKLDQALDRKADRQEVLDVKKMSVEQHLMNEKRIEKLLWWIIGTATTTILAVIISVLTI